MDLYLTGRDYFPTRNVAEQITLSESMASLLPEIYPVITPAAERLPAFLKLTDENIMAKPAWPKE